MSHSKRPEGLAPRFHQPIGTKGLGWTQDRRKPSVEAGQAQANPKKRAQELHRQWKKAIGSATFGAKGK